MEVLLRDIELWAKPHTLRPPLITIIRSERSPELVSAWIQLWRNLDAKEFIQDSQLYQVHALGRSHKLALEEAFGILRRRVEERNYSVRWYTDRRGQRHAVTMERSGYLPKQTKPKGLDITLDDLDLTF